MKSDIDQLASDLAAARKSGGAKVIYSGDLKRRVASMYRRQGGPLSRFADSLGVSVTAVTAWLNIDAPKRSKMLPVNIVPSLIKASSAASSAPTADSITMEIRGVVIRLPASTPPAQVAAFVQALAKG